MWYRFKKNPAYWIEFYYKLGVKELHFEFYSKKHTCEYVHAILDFSP